MYIRKLKLKFFTIFSWKYLEASRIAHRIVHICNNEIYAYRLCYKYIYTYHTIIPYNIPITTYV